MWAAVIAAAIQVGGTLLAQWLASGKDEEERRLRLAAVREYAALRPPEEREYIAQQVRTATRGIRADSGQRALQDEVQGRLMDSARSGGNTLRARAAAEEARMEAAAGEREMREGALGSLRARGLMGSGEEVLAGLVSSQGAADRERMAGMRRLADSEQAALQALIAGGQLAGQREERDWGQQMELARAEDDIARFNAGSLNQMRMFNAQQRQQAFENQLMLADRRAGNHQGMAQMAARDAQRTRERVGGATQAVGYGVAAYQGAQSQPQPVRSAGYDPGRPATVGTAAALDPALRQQNTTRRLR